MNAFSSNILLHLYKNQKLTQRDLANLTGFSLGIINKNLKELKLDGYIEAHNILTDKAIKLIKDNSPENAVILAAGVGLRMTPINKDYSKGLLIVNNKTLIENVIIKLQESGINKIYIVVGYMKEQYEYLIDKYKVQLIINTHYLEYNNVYSFYLARDYIHNSYIIPCDLWLKENIFRNIEINSWYTFDENTKIMTDYKTLKNSSIRLLAKQHYNNKPLGIAYLNNDDSLKIKNYLNQLDFNLFLKKHYYWENIILEKLNLQFDARYLKGTCYEINTFEDLRDLDPQSESLHSNVIDIILDSLKINITDIKNITLSKKGMTNRSFLFEIKDKKYIMRIPGEGTDQLINRKEEGEVYKAIQSLNISDEVLYFNEVNGYKLTKFIDGSRVCDLNNEDDLKNCMKFLKKIHHQNITVKHYFDIYKKIDFYESLRGKYSLYKDYDETKNNILKLKNIINSIPQNISLTHIDAVPDNFLIYTENGKESIKLIDWEYASMQDTDVDIAMFCIYALYDKKHIDVLIDIYYEEKCPQNIRLKIYCYIAICGLLWSNWCEYKHSLGVEFGEYSLAQYRYAKEYYHYAIEYKLSHQL